MGQGSLTWERAQTACRDNGDDLASILTQEDYTAFQSITETQQFDMWIGLYWKTSTRMWEWSNGDPFPYCVSEPQLGASNCCSLTRQGHGQTEHASLDKINCSLKRPFLCTGSKTDFFYWTDRERKYRQRLSQRALDWIQTYSDTINMCFRGCGINTRPDRPQDWGYWGM
jgi:hypothetical protein